MIFVIDDDEIMAECVARSCVGHDTRIFSNGIEAMDAISSSAKLPDLIFLDVLLDGPSGFAFLNELISYSDTAEIPVVVVTSLDMKEDLEVYGVKAVLKKESMTPQEILGYAEKYARR